MAGLPIPVGSTGRPGAVIPSSAMATMHAMAATHALRALAVQAGAPAWTRG
jgi:hypothetical protein